MGCSKNDLSQLHVVSKPPDRILSNWNLESFLQHEFMKSLLLCWNRLRHITTLFRKNIHNTQVLRQFYTLQLAWAVSKMNALKEVMLNNTWMFNEFLSISSKGNFNQKKPNQTNPEWYHSLASLLRISLHTCTMDKSIYNLQLKWKLITHKL